MADWFAIPLLALTAFERMTRLHVTVHEYTGALWGFLPPERFVHGTPACLAAKAIRLSACVRFDVHQTEGALAERPDGRVHVCHAGLVEWVVPTIAVGQLQRVWFAGQRRPGKQLNCARSDAIDVHRSWAAHLEALDPVDDDEADDILEMLRQLAARIEQWWMNPPSAVLGDPATGEGAGKTAAVPLNRRLIARQHAIRHFIQAHHTKPIGLIDLARHLHLSESRTGHAVTQACGRSFIDLLVNARLATAAGLLRHTGMTIAEIAEASGFGNLSHFHQVFRRRFQLTPHCYRRASETAVLDTQGLRLPGQADNVTPG